MKLAITLITALLFQISSFAGTIDPRVPDQRYRDYGKNFKNVVKIKGVCGCGKGSRHEFYGSAVIISPNWALTAAHVVKDGSEVELIINEKKEDYSFSVKTIIHEDFDDKNLGYNDIAICYSEKDFELDFYPELYSEEDEEGKIVSMAGYGITGSFLTGSNTSDNYRRAGSNRIVRSERNVLVCNLIDQRTELEFLIASGDSGGGLFIGNKLAGIHTFVMADDGKPDSSYRDESAHTRISLYFDWITKKMKENESR